MAKRIFVCALIVIAEIYSNAAWADDIQRDRLKKLLRNSPSVVQFAQTRPGVVYFISFKDNNLASPTFGMELCILEVARAAGALFVKDIRMDKSPAMIYEKAFPPNVVGIMTGGFFAVNNHGKLIPQGLVRSGRQERSPKYPWTSGGIVGVRNGLTQIIPISQAGETKKFSEALQSKPILIWNGEDGIFSAQNERFDRSAVGIDKHGNIFFFVLSEPTGMAASLAEFSYLLMQYRSTMGTAISAALAMDGGPGAHLYVPELKRHCGAGTPNYVPNALYIR